jgi:hypothetical protein
MAISRKLSKARNIIGDVDVYEVCIRDKRSLALAVNQHPWRLSEGQEAEAWRRGSKGRMRNIDKY